MNRKIVYCLVFAVACVMAGIFWYTTHSTDRMLRNISRELGIDICGGEIVKSEDTHGGFHGDGHLLVSVKFTNDKVGKELASSKEWQAFPLDAAAQTLLYGREIEGGRVGPFVTDRDGNRLVPPVRNGYYWLRDRQPESENQIKRDGATNGLRNFTIVVYDKQENMLYYCKMDT